MTNMHAVTKDTRSSMITYNYFPTTTPTSNDDSYKNELSKDNNLAITWSSGSKTYEMSYCYRVNHVHGDITHTEYSQAFGSAKINQGPNHELISLYQVQPSVHA